MRIGGNHGGCGPQSSHSTQNKGGSGEHAKVKGGSGEHKSVGGSGEKSAKEQAKSAGVPYGQWKKQFHDSFDGLGDRIRENVQQTISNVWDNKSGGGLVGGFLGMLGGFLGFGNHDSFLNGAPASSPTAVANGQKVSTTNPVVDLGNQSATGQAKPLPFVSQYAPGGADANYKNAAMNCGPALLASIAKANGLQPPGVTDAQLITNQMKKAGTTEAGTTGNGMISALEDMGMQTAASPSADMNWINSQLAMGHDVLANGDYFSVPGRMDANQAAGHYVAVTAVNNGLYTITDPADGGVTSMTADQLSAFIRNHPEGGFTISAWT